MSDRLLLDAASRTTSLDNHTCVSGEALGICARCGKPSADPVHQPIFPGDAASRSIPAGEDAELVERLRGWLATSSPERHEAIAAEFPSLLARLSSMSNELDRVKAERDEAILALGNVTASKLVSQMAHLLERAEAAEAVVAAISSELEQVRAENARLRNELGRLGDAYDEEDRKAHERESALEAEIARLQQELADARAERDRACRDNGLLLASAAAKGDEPDILLTELDNERACRVAAEALARQQAEEIGKLRGALKPAEEALRPFYNAVFNDNGDITVTGSYDYEEAVAGYFAYRLIAAALSKEEQP